MRTDRPAGRVPRAASVRERPPRTERRADRVEGWTEAAIATERPTERASAPSPHSLMDFAAPAEPPGQHGVGIVAPFDFALDRELWRWAPDDVSLHLTRLPYVPVPVTVDMAAALSDSENVRRATCDLLAPEPLVVAYACASGSFVHGVEGERRLRASISDAGAPASVTTSGALMRALDALGTHRIAVVTPYVDSVTERLLRYLDGHGVETVSSVGLGLLNHIWKVSYSEVVRAVRDVDTPEAEAVFISCTNVLTYDIIEPLERMLGKPVLAANQVTVWAALRAIGRRPVAHGQWLVEATGHDPA